MKRIKGFSSLNITVLVITIVIVSLVMLFMLHRSYVQTLRLDALEREVRSLEDVVGGQEHVTHNSG